MFEDAMPVLTSETVGDKNISIRVLSVIGAANELGISIGYFSGCSLLVFPAGLT